MRPDRLLDFFLLEKAFYEIEYELAHRPDWLRVPLAGHVAHPVAIGGGTPMTSLYAGSLCGASRVATPDPFRYLGPHLEGDVPVVRVFLPDAGGGGVVIDDAGPRTRSATDSRRRLVRGWLTRRSDAIAYVRAMASSRSRSMILIGFRRFYRILIFTCWVKAHICISTRSWAPIRWNSMAYPAWRLRSSPPQPGASVSSAISISGMGDGTPCACAGTVFGRFCPEAKAGAKYKYEIVGPTAVCCR